MTCLMPVTLIKSARSAWTICCAVSDRLEMEAVTGCAVSGSSNIENERLRNFSVSVGLNVL